MAPPLTFKYESTKPPKQMEGYLLLHKEDDRRRLEGRKHQVCV